MPKFLSEEMNIPAYAQESLDRWRKTLHVTRRVISDRQLMFVLFHLGQQPDGTGAAPMEETTEAKLREALQAGRFDAPTSGE